MLNDESNNETNSGDGVTEEMTPEERAMVEMVEGSGNQNDKNLKLEEFEADKNNLDSSFGTNNGSELDLSAVYDVPVMVSAILGRTAMPVNQLLKLGRGAVVELDSRVGEPIDILVNNRLIARGEVVVMDDNKLGITMTEIIKSDRI